MFKQMLAYYHIKICLKIKNVTVKGKVLITPLPYSALELRFCMGRVLKSINFEGTQRVKSGYEST